MTADNEIKIGSSLKRFRKEFKLTQDDVAKAIGIFRPLYTKYEGDKNTPSVDTVIKIANAFNVSMDYLVGLSDTPHPVPYNEKEVREAFAFRDAWQKAMQSLPQVPAQ